MNADKCSEAVQDGVTFFSTGGGTALFVLGIAGLVIGIPTGVTVIVVGVSALLFGILGVWRAVRRHNKEQAEAEKNTPVADEKSAHSREVKEHNDVALLIQQIAQSLKEAKGMESKDIPIELELVDDESEEIDADEIFAKRNDSSYREKPHFFSERSQAVNDDVYQPRVKQANKCAV